MDPVYKMCKNKLQKGPIFIKFSWQNSYLKFY